MTPAQAAAFQSKLHAWFRTGHRPMPWRETQDAYRIWLAEVMLQQTTVAAVIPYYQRFLAAFPTVEALAAAPIGDVLHLWQGLGYYRRAHLLHACAQVVSHKHNGIFPATEAELLTLPGIGPYTAAVVAATAFNQPATVVDGNVERVITRLSRIQTPLPAAKPEIKQRAAALSSRTEARLHANAMMELGATVCTPQNPKCVQCPVAAFCAALTHGDQATYPRKSPKKKLPEHHATVYVLTDPTGHLYLQQRPLGGGLLAGLWELPHSGWEPKPKSPAPAIPPHINPQPAGSITHTFTHFKLTLNVIHAHSSKPHPAHHAFRPTALPPLSTLMKKALKISTGQQQNR